MWRGLGGGRARHARRAVRAFTPNRPPMPFAAAPASRLRAHYLPAVDQEAMVAVRDAWFQEVGGPPAGNKRARGGRAGRRGAGGGWGAAVPPVRHRLPPSRLSQPPSPFSVMLEKAAWTQPVSAGAISERGRAQAAEGQAAELLAALRTRGCNEDMVAVPELLLEGKASNRECGLGRRAGGGQKGGRWRATHRPPAHPLPLPAPTSG